jgi:hypothetical protein
MNTRAYAAGMTIRGKRKYLSGLDKISAKPCGYLELIKAAVYSGAFIQLFIPQNSLM